MTRSGEHEGSAESSQVFRNPSKLAALKFLGWSIPTSQPNEVLSSSVTLSEPRHVDPQVPIDTSLKPNVWVVTLAQEHRKH